MENGSLTVALAMLAGVLASGIARHLRVPGIVLLLATGVLIGPDAANIVRPGAAGEGLSALVGFAVAIILFEGGLHMNIRKLAKEAVAIRRLVTVGALVTAAGGAVAAMIFMGWDWRLSVLFGTLVIVTGPTVITPLLRRLRVNKNVSTILEAEGIFIDAVGATIAVVALDVLLAPLGESWKGVFGFVQRLGIGAGVGLVGGFALALLLLRRRVVPQGLENVLGLAFAVAVFQVSNAIAHESGITAAIVAGMVVSNLRSEHAFDELVDFKEQLVSFLIATLFVLLAADVRIDTVVGLGSAGLLTVGALMFVVRPITVAVSTYGTNLTGREKVFLSWLAPRGIVAAAVASLFATELAARGVEGGVEMKALVFLVIATTVTVQGLSGGFLAKALGIKRPSNHGYAILGANKLARTLGGVLRGGGQPVVLIDANHDACQVARNEGFEVVEGNGLEPDAINDAMCDSRIACVGLTVNENVNFLFARKVTDLYRGVGVAVALETADDGVTSDMVEALPAGIMFGHERELAVWLRLLQADQVQMETWEYQLPSKEHESLIDAPTKALLPLAVMRSQKAQVVTDNVRLRKGDLLRVGVNPDRRDQGYEWLRKWGFVPHSGPAAERAASEAEA